MFTGLGMSHTHSTSYGFVCGEGASVSWELGRGSLLIGRDMSDGRMNFSIGDKHRQIYPPCHFSDELPPFKTNLVFQPYLILPLKNVHAVVVKVHEKFKY